MSMAGKTRKQLKIAEEDVKMGKVVEADLQGRVVEADLQGKALLKVLGEEQDEESSVLAVMLELLIYFEKKTEQN